MPADAPAETVDRAKLGRLHILEKMKAVVDQPLVPLRLELLQHARAEEDLQRDEGD